LAAVLVSELGLALEPVPELGLALVLELGLVPVRRKQLTDYQGLKLLPSKRKGTFS